MATSTPTCTNASNATTSVIAAKRITPGTL
jgi:hypothetical protein